MTNSTYDYDLLVIGAGPGGYHAAIRAAQLGLKVACAEMGAVGGVCLNVGCIPTKALLHAAEEVVSSQHAAEFGLTFADTKLDISKLNGWKQGIVSKLTGGVSSLFKANKVTHLVGQASFVDAHTLKVGEKNYSAANIIIATGSEPAKLPGIEVDQKSIVDSTGALQVPEKVPARMLCIGGGVIGFEFASIYNNLGSKVTIIEFMPHVIPGADAGTVAAYRRIIEKQGITIQTQTKANSASVQSDGSVLVEIENVATGEKRTETFDRVLVAVGRRPRSAGLNLEAVGITPERGFITVNNKLQTSVPHIYAIGDVAGNPMLAHKAMKEGLVAAAVIAGDHSAEQDAVAIPGVVYTSPELAWVGLTEEEARGKGYQIKTGQFPFSASGRAMTLQSTDGFVKMVVDAGSDVVLGVHIVGPHASDMLGEASLALEMGATAEDIALTIHAHPTLGESVLEAAEAVHKQAIHIVNR